MSWRSEAKYAIRQYPYLKRKLDALQCQSVTANYSGAPCGGGAQRTTENVALRSLPPDEQKMLDAVEHAKKTTLRQYYPEGQRHLDVIALMYWRSRKLNATAVSYRLHYSVETIWRWHDAFVTLVDTLLN